MASKDRKIPKIKNLKIFDLSLNNNVNIAIWIEKKIDSDQNVEWYWNIVGSKHKNKTVKKHTRWLNFFEITVYKKKILTK